MAELPNLGSHCSVITCKQLDFLPFQCSGCEKIFCSDHKFPDNHGCSRVLIQENTGEYDGVRGYSCSLNNCHQREQIEVVCEFCLKNFCLAHRHQSDHGCENIKVVEDKTKTAEHVKKILDSKAKSVGKTIITKGSKSSKTAAKVNLMKLKMKASGSQSIPQNDRVYFNTYLPLQNKDKTKAVFVSKMWTVGRALDSIADLCGISNTNNKSCENKLKLFRHGEGDALDNGATVEKLLSDEVIFDGSNIVIECVLNDVLHLPNKNMYK